MNIFDFEFYKKQKRLCTIIHEINTLMGMLDSNDKIVQLKELLDEFYELKSIRDGGEILEN